MEIFWKSVKKYRVLWIFTIVMLLLAVISLVENNSRQSLVYNQSLDKVVATVESEEITLRDFAFYVAYQESEVHKQAVVYDPENPKKYWNTRLNGQFIRTAIRNGTVEMAIHDAIFYQLSKQYKIELTEEEKKALKNSADDFWYDLTDREGDTKMGISRRELYETMERIAVAEKCQYIYALEHGRKYEDYGYAQEDYLELKDKYKTSVDKDILERIPFGDVTL